MTEETIIIEIDDSQLDAALIKLDLMGQQAKKITGTANLKEGLPGINRELRLILGRFPGMRQAIQAYFRVKRLEMGLTSEATFAESITSFQGILTIVATLIIYIEALRRRHDKMEKAQKDLEAFIKRERGVNREGYIRLLADWQKTLRGVPP